ncbi:MAG TPA: signal peptidase I [Alphaproteobacteria bacterium]
MTQRSGRIAKKSRADGFWETFKTVVYAVLIATVVRTFAYEPFHIPSGSMIPSLLIGDYLFVSKFSYGYSRYSFPFDIGVIEGRIMAHQPERGDIAVFKLPRDNKTDYIKRLIGLPGDHIQVRDGLLYINDQPVQRRQIEDYELVDRIGNVTAVDQYVETLPNGIGYRIIDSNPYGPLDNTDVYVVPADHYFAMGDNRDGSSDSRILSNVGYVPAENLVGRAEILFFSTDGTAHFWEVWKWPFATRFWRFGILL